MRVPKYRRNGDGRAFAVWPNAKGRREYFGTHGTAESERQYKQWLARVMVADHPAPPPPAGDPSVAELAVHYLDYAEKHCRKEDGGSGNFPHVKYAISHLLTIHADTPATQIGPAMLIDLQLWMVKQGYGVSTINSRVNHCARFIRWCSQRELIPAETYHKITCVENVRPGQHGLKRSKPVQPVEWLEVCKVLPFVSLQVSAMIQVQFLCGMRPQDVCRIRRRDIDESGETWLYRPEHHKTEHHGHELVKAIPPAAQAILRQFFSDDPGRYLFSPQESDRWHREQAAAKKSERITPVYPSETKRLEKAKQKREKHPPSAYRKGEKFTTGSYRRSIARGFEKAQEAGVTVSTWSPNRLRHAIATYLRENFGQESAQVWLGHEKLDTTEVYARKKLTELIQVAAMVQDYLQAEFSLGTASPPPVDTASA